MLCYVWNKATLNGLFYIILRETSILLSSASFTFIPLAVNKTHSITLLIKDKT